MPQTSLIFFKETDGSIPVLDWLDELERRDQKAWAKCRGRLLQLKALGYELRRPAADLLQDGIRKSTHMMKPKQKRRTSDVIEILDRRMRGKPELQKLAGQAKTDCDIAQLIYDARSEANLTQKDLAELIGTTQSVIARLEDASYDGHSLTMLNRIASALHRRIEIRLLPESKWKAA